MGLAMAGASAVTGLVGGIMGASGAAEQGAATSAADSYQAEVARNNAIISQQNATAEMESGEIAATNSGLQTRAKIGTMAASQGANGVDINSGSAAAVRAGADQTGMLDALTIRSNAARKAYGYEVQATNDTAQAGLDDMGAANAEKAGQIGADTSLLSGATATAKAFSGFYNQGGRNSFGSFNLGTG